MQKLLTKVSKLLTELGNGAGYALRN